MEKKHPVNELMEETIQRIRQAVDANTIVGQPIQAGEVTIIPVSKVSFGFGTGGSELDGKGPQPHPLGGGGGAGVKVTPVCFLVVSGTNVRVLPTAPYPESSLDRVLDLIPDAVGKVSEFLEKKKDKGTDEALDDVFVE